MITTFYPPYHFGGDAYAIRGLTHALARRGHQVDVIHDADAWRMLSQAEEPKPITEPEGVRVHTLRSKFGKLSCLATHQLGRPVVHGPTIRKILDTGFDVIHFHNISLVGGPGVLSYGEGIKLYTAHEHWLVCPTHVLWRHGREICTERQCLRCVLNHGRPPQLWRSTNLLKNQCEHIDTFCTPSQFCAGKHREFGFDRDMFILPNFLPDTAPAEDRPSEEEEISDKPFFLFVGRLEHIKGLQDVIPHFSNDGPELWIAGKGNYETELREMASGRGCVRFLGQQTQDQLRSLYRRARAVVLPSICYEVFPMVVLEAYREGTPIIARRLGPYPEIVEQSEGGLLFETQEDLGNSLSLLATDDDLRTRLGKAGREAFENSWCEEVVLNRYFDLIQSIASRRQLTSVLEKFQVC